jgi:class 3 adenylate cyclase
MVLCSDVCEYTALSEELDPEYMSALQSRVEQLATDAVTRHGGTIFGRSSVDLSDPAFELRGGASGLQPDLMDDRVHLRRLPQLPIDFCERVAATGSRAASCAKKSERWREPTCGATISS